MSEQPFTLYSLCINVAVTDCVTLCRFCKKEFRLLPDNVLFDFYYKMYTEKRLCLLGVEYSELQVFSRMLKVKHKRSKLLKSFQSLIDHGSNVMEELLLSYSKYRTTPEPITSNIIDIGLKLGGFLNEGGWYNYSVEVLNVVEELCKKRSRNANTLCKLLDCYHKRLHAESVYCMFKCAEDTFERILSTKDELQKLNAVPNLAGLYANISALFFARSEYDEAYQWAQRSLKLLNEDVPPRVIIEVLRQASKSCVVKRRFLQAKLLIHQAVGLASLLYYNDHHPCYSDTLMDYGFYLLNYDTIQESVKVYEKALGIRKDIFEKNNIHVAIGHEDLAYALYVNEYSSGRFYAARENADRAIRIMDKILPKDHLMLASAMRVKALILEEIALDLRDLTHLEEQDQLLLKAEQFHKSALQLSHSAFGEHNVQTAKHYGNLGRLYQTMMKHDEAEKMHLRAISIKEQLLGPDDYEVGLSLGHLASLYSYHMKKHRDAEKLYKRSIDISLKLFGVFYSGLEYDYRGLIHVYTELNDIPNMLHYTHIMREWKFLRENHVTTNNFPDHLESLNTILTEFFKMC
ncbi:hypothetical protein PPYR_13534 [Photinus pyralis]|uniref:MalT-like TPR region domain-containing protein n=1 Tax=Photinus pyralis TaxID=7054 RepID=A0A1Y1NHY2_PHOPY|nr:amyloid protein-binding protein 2 isoform X1 [Photinus pyralis]KAB0793914.1 hypothetical protein PPYR_13534 [Photinus pyralis]